MGIWIQPTKEAALTQPAAFQVKCGKLYPEAVRSLSEEEDETLTFYDFPQTMHRYIRTTNAIESLFSNVRQWADQIDVFTAEMSCVTIVWATIDPICLGRAVERAAELEEACDGGQIGISRRVRKALSAEMRHYFRPRRKRNKLAYESTT